MQPKRITGRPGARRDRVCITLPSGPPRRDGAATHRYARL